MSAADDDGWGTAHGGFLETLTNRGRRLAERHLLLTKVEPDRPAGGGGTERPVDGDDVDDLDRLDPASRELSEAIATDDERLEEHRKELIDLGRCDGLSALAAAAGLNRMETEAVAAALCAELDPAIGARYAELHRDPANRFATAGLVAALHQLDATQTWQLIDPARPLLRFGLVERGATVPGAPLRLEGRVMRFLLGQDHIDERLAGLVSIMGPTPLPERLAQLADDIAGRLVDPTMAGPSAVNLIGPSAETRAVFAGRLLGAIGMVPLRLNLDRLLARADRAELSRLIERECLMLPAGTYVEVDSGPGDAPDSAVAAEEMLDELGGLVIIGSPMRREGDRPTLVVEVDDLDGRDRAELWAAVIGQPIAGIDRIVEQFALGPQSIERAAAEARAAIALRAGPVAGDRAVPTVDELWTACRRHVGRDLERLAHRVVPAGGWDDLVLPADQLEILHELTAQIANRARVYEEWGFGAKLTRGRGVSTLFTGPPGTGKTMAAEIIAAELELDLYRIDLASVVSKYIGETEKNLKRVFDAAERGGAILFFDEADALFGKRTEVKDSHDRHANIEVNYLLQRMEEYAGLAILATNRKADLDPAFLRRVRFIVTFPFPSEADRRRIWEVVMPDAMPRRDLDHEVLAKLELAGGNIRNAALNGAFRAADADQPLDMSHLMLAAHHEYRKLDKLPTRAEFGHYYELVSR